jgi:5-methyltetrahydrofolate--homocysteine methyltransferase
MSEGRQMSEELASEYARMRSDYQQEQQQLLSMDEARKNKLNLFEK